MSDRNEQKNDVKSEEQVLTDDALESVAGGTLPGSIGIGGIGPITTTIAYPMPVPFPGPIDTTTA